uniref:Reverse transcriptase domain-containing protein n=1 Tax=Tanacetum cinerariifolium TaxID=118510 RepID=A0A699IA84_TANCI|nr:reverse transcriptase domain-containing protein [Tanacetum cinerariifolium]
MQTRSSSRLVSDQSFNPTSSTNPNPKGRNYRRSKQRVENSNLEEHSHPIVTMADQRTMAQFLQAPTEGYEDAIFIPAITADNFKLKHGLITLVQNNLRNEITNFQQRFDESFSEAWDRFKDLLRACPHHGFLELHQLDTFYNALISKDQDSLNSATGGNFLDKMPRDCLSIIESKSKVRYLRDKPVVAKVSTNASTSGVSPDVAELKDMVKAFVTPPKMCVAAEYCPRALLHNTTTQDTRERPLKVSFVKKNSLISLKFIIHLSHNCITLKSSKATQQDLIICM